MFRRILLAVIVLSTFAAAVPTQIPPRAARGKLTVYWGAEDSSTTLDNVCSDPSYDIVNLAFLSYFFRDGGYPQLSISTLGGPSPAQQAAGATSLQDGAELVPALRKCQRSGKRVILSMGGAQEYADVTLKDDAQGEHIAQTVWDLFLGGTNNAALRPFGSVKLDGVDLDNESANPTGYVAMTKKFRSLMNADASKQYFLTAAPQCPFPDASEPLDVVQLLDYVWVQFYNNGDCNIAQSGFNDAVRTWSRGIGNATLFIGALASGADGDQGFVDASTFNSAIEGVKAMNLPNYGGAMLWEAQLAVNNGNYQTQIRGSL
ncbi:chitinase 1 precursor, putative [Cordyceps militaris CM01]|uniref:chitinase n=1 Tax=Cordyceps militaris (strain CM01) TaxID=983644 RepID=G3JTI7_CORMM|nr:chitinase 1 precursor, putative [Cordyceps militaris CM01]EGX87991.1 chitinase 1 precursor, putative [Cordyceps militaris CM01]